MQAEAGKVTLVIGRNGSGKSTLLKTIFGLVAATAGHVLVDGEDVSREAPEGKVRRGLALVPQTSNQGRGIFEALSVEENLALGAFVRHRPRELEGARARVLTLFPALSHRLAAKAGTLSGGQQQMVAIGVALMSGPRILMLDEPTSGLAAGVAQELARTIRDIAASLDVAVLLVEQNVNLALSIADRVYACRGGRVVREGSPDEVMRGTRWLDIL
jgi:branched-chain amino acid transport system ATP-binding protein